MGIMTTPKRRILSFIFTVLCFKKSLLIRTSLSINLRLTRKTLASVKFRKGEGGSAPHGKIKEWNTGESISF